MYLPRDEARYSNDLRWVLIMQHARNCLKSKYCAKHAKRRYCQPERCTNRTVFADVMSFTFCAIIIQLCPGKASWWIWILKSYWSLVHDEIFSSLGVNYREISTSKTVKFQAGKITKELRLSLKHFEFSRTESMSYIRLNFLGTVICARNWYFCGSIRKLSAYANEANFVNRASSSEINLPLL